MKAGVYFISGIDTDIGKTIATGTIAKKLVSEGKSVITQKLVQTGCGDWADDVLIHRAIMNLPLQAADIDRLTMPQIFHYPASPHLAARLDKRHIDVSTIIQATQQLSEQYNIVLIEGAGGLAVPLTDSLLIIDYIKQNNYPVILITSGRLGSINHTLLSLMALKQQGIELYALIYNHLHDHLDNVISTETQQFLRNYTIEQFPHAYFWEMARLSPAEMQTIAEQMTILLTK